MLRRERYAETLLGTQNYLHSQELITGLKLSIWSGCQQIRSFREEAIIVKELSFHRMRPELRASLSRTQHSLLAEIRAREMPLTLPIPRVSPGQRAVSLSGERYGQSSTGFTHTYDTFC